ncbi:MAG: transcription-repair coupling factor [Phycisphaerae bacterium]|nr:transcription-repair coupling factor [Phycisphaerae bacterium]
MNIGQLKSVQEIISQLKTVNRAVKIAGTWGSFARLLALHIHEQLKKPILYISPYLDEADNVVDDLIAFHPSSVYSKASTPVEASVLDKVAADKKADYGGQVGGKTIETLPGWAGEEFVETSDEISSARARLVLGLAPAQKGGGIRPPQAAAAKCAIISTSIQALMQPVPRPEKLLEKGLLLEVGKQIEMDKASAWLADNGFENAAQIDTPGQFAKRGGIIDIFAPVTTLSNQPIALRVEFFGDTIESIRIINLDTQRSAEHINDITITSTRPDDDKDNQTNFLKIIDPETIIFIEEPGEAQEVADVFLHRVEKPEKLYKWGEIYEAMGNFKKVFISRFAGDLDNIELRIKSTQQFEHKNAPAWSGHREVLRELVQMAEQGWNVNMFCENAAEVKRVEEIIAENKQPRHSDGGANQNTNFHLPIGFVHKGFIIEDIKTIVVTHHELFGQAIVRRTIRPVGAAISIDSITELNKGDYVVHINYGIGKFKGIEIIEKHGRKCEFLTLQYADKAIIHVPAETIGLVQKYIGTSAGRPKLNKIGTKKWENQKKKVAAATADFAAELLEMQARRQSIKGISYEADSNWQREFEQSFLYQETPDQIGAVEQIKADMQKPLPMDRLLCGDVGYGKTELAMRAAFKAVEGGKQVAVLVPTTVLCIQHERTFTQRFADFPIAIESVNRFKTKAQAADILKRTKRGTVDILIGTHRLLSGDVGFKDLGLLIIDEEQRFGVEHKEKLKKMRINVDVLTMTATPIPRTLHMAMLGLRDISSLATPPLDRRAVVTGVKKYDAELIKKAVTLELNRQGQVFFVHNRVQTIEKIADEIQKLLPEVKIAVAHGQMHKHELEKAMIDFVLGETNMLVCSAIIESGIDIPNANTIIVNNADRFGLAQLHQLRGRVGRFKYRAFAYFLLPKTRSISPIAVKRLKAIEEYSQLGAGFKIALRDLEIRGAGNILGLQQSGHINTVGYELFCRLLAEAVKRLKNEPVEKEPLTVIDLGFSTFIPRNYIPSDSQRMNVYRQIAAARTSEDLARLTEQLKDMFGEVTEETKRLIDLAEIRILASAHNIGSITIMGKDVVFVFENPPPQGWGLNKPKLFAGAPGIVRIPDAVTVHIRLEDKYFEPQTLLAMLRKILRKKK